MESRGKEMVMTTLEGTNLNHTADGGTPLSVHDLREHPVVPDDLSGLAEIPSIGEPGEQPEPHRAARTVRWLRWVPLLVLAVAGVVLAAILMTNDGPGTETPWAANEGPGGHSLTVPLLTAETPWVANDGPGGHSLTVPLLTAETPWAANDGPGGHTLNTVEP